VSGQSVAQWRRRIALGVGLAAALALGCGRDLSAWRAALAEQGAERLVGIWSAQIRLDRPAGDTLPPKSIGGELGFTLNEKGLSAPGFGAPPMLFGTYDIAFDSLGFRAGTYSGVPAVVGRLNGDSLDLKLAPESDHLVEFHGVLRGDSIVGRWRAVQTRGIDAVGDFTLRRR
jgi:hypothetical protein